MNDKELIHIQPMLKPVTPLEAHCDLDTHGLCPTCADEALPAKVLQVEEDGWTAVLEVNGQASDIDVSLIDDVRIGQVLLIHGGVALERLEREA